MAIVYQHRRLDTNEIFYIGIGKTIARSKSKKNRNKYWHHIVDKVGYDVQILHNDITWERACEIEKDLIKQYGRKDLNLGTLVNMTDGGEGVLNMIVSDETRLKQSKSQLGKKHPMEVNAKKGVKGENNPSKRIEVRKKISESNIGREKSDKTRKKISLKLSGENGNNSKLKNEDILFIRNSYIKSHIEFGTKALSIKFNVCQRAIQSIIKKTRWKHL